MKSRSGWKEAVILQPFVSVVTYKVDRLRVCLFFTLEVTAGVRQMWLRSGTSEKGASTLWPYEIFHARPLTATDLHARCQRLVPSQVQTARESERRNRSQVSLSVTSSCPAVLWNSSTWQNTTLSLHIWCFLKWIMTAGSAVRWKNSDALKWSFS